MRTVGNPEFVGEIAVAENHVKGIICHQQLLLIIPAGIEPLNLFQFGTVFIAELPIWIVGKIPRCQTVLSIHSHSSEYPSPLSVPSAAGLSHILGIRPEGHTQGCAAGEEFGMLLSQDHSPESTHGIACESPVLPVCNGPETLVYQRHKLLGEHIHIIMFAVVPIAVIVVVA